MASFFEDVTAANVNYKAIVAVIDNFASHKIVKDKTAELGIYLVYLPPYSPDLNPIEHMEIHKKAAFCYICQKPGRRKRIISEGRARFSRYMSYAKAWIHRFLEAVGHSYADNYKKAGGRKVTSARFQLSQSDLPDVSFLPIR